MKYFTLRYDKAKGKVYAQGSPVFETEREAMDHAHGKFYTQAKHPMYIATLDENDELVATTIVKRKDQDALDIVVPESIHDPLCSDNIWEIKINDHRQVFTSGNVEGFVLMIYARRLADPTKQYNKLYIRSLSGETWEVVNMQKRINLDVYKDFVTD